MRNPELALDQKTKKIQDILFDRNFEILKIKEEIEKISDNPNWTSPEKKEKADEKKRGNT